MTRNRLPEGARYKGWDARSIKVDRLWGVRHTDLLALIDHKQMCRFRSDNVGDRRKDWFGVCGPIGGLVPVPQVRRSVYSSDTLEITEPDLPLRLLRP